MKPHNFEVGIVLGIITLLTWDKMPVPLLTICIIVSLLNIIKGLKQFK